MLQFGTIKAGIEYQERPGGYAVVIRDGLVAVVKTPGGVFLPGGGAENNESLAEAAIRETKEETGLIVEITGKIGMADEFVSSDKYNAHFQKVCTFFSAEITSRIGQWEPDHDLDWTTPADAVALLTHGSQKWAVSEHFSLRVVV